MARRLNREPAPDAGTAAPASTPADDLYTLMPKRWIDVAGRHLLLEEIPFETGMLLRAKARPLTDALDALLGDVNEDTDEPQLEQYLDLMAEHYPLVRELMIESIDGIDADFLKTLNDPDGKRLLISWWETCGRFFWREVVARRRDRLLVKLRRKAKAAEAAAPAGSTSSPPSPASPEPNSATSPAATPSAS